MRKLVVIGSIVLMLLLAGCSGSTPATPAPDLEIVYEPIVSATGEVVPAVWATLSTQTGGTVQEVRVQPGDSLASGAVAVQLDPTDSQLALLQTEAALAAAQAQVTLLQAGPRPQEVTALQAQIAAAQAALDQATAQSDHLAAGATRAEIAAAEAQVAAAEATQRSAQEAYDQTLRCVTVAGPDGSEQEVCPGLGAPEEQARYGLHAAAEALAAAQAQLNALRAGADGNQLRAARAGVAAATAQRDVAQAQLELLQAGATPEQLAVAQAAVTQAEAALAAAEANLARCEIRAPFGGTVGAVYVRAGELVAPGQPLAVLGDLSTLRVETTDLDEIDVARVAEGQTASVTFDALPEQVFTGRVARISPMAAQGTGGVNYTVIIELDDLDPAVRWGMTAFVDIEVGE